MKKLSVLLALILLLTSVSSLSVSFAKEIDTTYEQTLFDHSKLIEIDIQMDKEAWDNMITTASSEEYSACNVMVNGVLYENVAIRPKGNSSMASVTSRGSERYSWRIKFDKYEKKRTCDGLDVLILNNGFNGGFLGYNSGSCRKIAVTCDYSRGIIHSLSSDDDGITHLKLKTVK